MGVVTAPISPRQWIVSSALHVATIWVICTHCRVFVLCFCTQTHPTTGVGGINDTAANAMAATATAAAVG